MNEVFINSSINSAFNNYKENKNSSDFLTIVIKIICNIYGEENVINLFDKNDYNSFIYLLNKYDVGQYYVDKLIDDIKKYDSVDAKNKIVGNNEKNPYFIYIQEDLINMFFSKYNSNELGSKKINEFKNMLYTPDNPSRIMVEYNEKNAFDKYYILNYFNSKIYEIKNKLEFTLQRSNYISNEVYEAFGLSKEKLDKLSTKDIEAINRRITNLYRINPIDPNLNKKLLEKINKSTSRKMYIKLTNNTKMTNLIIFVIIVFVILILFLIIMLIMKG